MNASTRLRAFRQSKLYDIAVGVPLMLWFGAAAVRTRPYLVDDIRTIAADGGTLIVWLHVFALAGSALFDLLLVALVVLRDPPRQRADGVLPRAVAVAGTFLAVAILQLPPRRLSLFSQGLADALILAGALGSLFVLLRLGRAFSIVPEARRLVTAGPYAYARHPLYAMEIFTIAGTALFYAQPWAAIIGVIVIALLILRTRFEERVLDAAFPAYAAYRNRVRRFGFF